MILQKKPQEGVINLLTTLSGTAWKQVEPIAEKASEDKDGFNMIMEVMDKTFRYDSRVEQPRSFERFFYSMSRRSDQTLMSYCAEHREALREVEKHNIKLPSEVTGWLMLRRSGLTQEQKQLVQGQCGATLEESKVEEAMYYLFGQDYRGRVGPQVRYNNHQHSKGKNNNWRKTSQAYTTYDEDNYEEEAYEAEEDPFGFEQSPDEENVYYEGEDTYDPEDDELLLYNEDDYPDCDDPEWEECYATYLDARRRFAELRNNRGFYPVVALTDQGTPSTPSSSQRPLPPRGKGKGQKGGKRQSSSHLNTSEGRCQKSLKSSLVELFGYQDMPTLWPARPFCSAMHSEAQPYIQSYLISCQEEQA